MKAIVFAAGGLVGYHVARALVLKGFTVYGVVRKQSDADQLELLGVQPIISDASEVKNYEDVLATATVVVDAGLGDFSVIQKGGDTAWVSRIVLEAARKASAKRPPGSAIRFIFTSGSGTIVSKGDEPVDETSPNVEHPALAGALKFQQELLASKDIIPTVLTLAAVYGGWFAAWDLLFTFNKETKHLDFPSNLTKASRVPFVHVNDVADAFAAVAAAPAGTVANQNYIVAADNRDNLLSVWTALAKGAGSDGVVEFVKEPNNGGYLALVGGMNQVLNTSKIQQQLGWKAKHVSPADEAPLLYRQYQAWLKVRKDRK